MIGNGLNISCDIEHLQKYIGSIYNVSDSKGNDSSDGRSPNTTLKTIGAAIGKLIQGDVIKVGQGTYTESGIDLNVNSCEIQYPATTRFKKRTTVEEVESDEYLDRLWKSENRGGKVDAFSSYV